MSLDSSGGAFSGNWKFAGALDIGAASFPLAKAAEIEAKLAALAAAFTAWLPAAGDGGSALKTLLTTLSGTGWPATPPCACTMTKGF
jgi:hypothetical protein